MSRHALPALTRALIRLVVPADWRESVAGDLEEEHAIRAASALSTGLVWTLRASATVILTGLRLTFDRRRARRAAERDTWATGTAGGRRVDAAGRGRMFPRPAQIAAEFRQAGRNLLAHRGYAITAILTFALGIGANVAVFNLANWLLLRPVPGVRDEARLVTVGFGSADGTRLPISVVDLDAIAAGAPALDGVAGYQTFPVHVTAGGGPARRVDAEVVTGRYFDVLGDPIAMGRGFSAREGSDPSAPPVAVISFRVWNGDLAGAPDVLGRTITVNRQAVTVVGVATRGFQGDNLRASADLWMPIGQHRIVMPAYPASLLTNRRFGVFFGLVGHLAPRASAAVAAAQIETVRTQVVQANPTDARMARFRYAVSEGLEGDPWKRRELGNSLALLAGIALLLLVLTAANVSNLMIAGAIARRGEIATRLALGASRAAVARLVVAESLLLSAAACAAALGLAWLVARMLEGTVVLQGLAPLDHAAIDWRVSAVALATSAGVALLAGTVPALSGTRVDVTAALREAGRSHTVHRQRLRRMLTAAQVAVSMTLLVGTGLLVRSMMARLAIDPGFDASRVLTFSLQPSLQGYGDRPVPFYRELLDRVREVPGVRAAAISWLRPSFQGVGSDTGFHAEGAAPGSNVVSETNAVSPGFFDAVGLPIIAGRDFSNEEFQAPKSDGPAVAIMTESLARRTFGDGPAVGRRIVSSEKDPGTTIIGLVRDTKQRMLTAPSSDMLFTPFRDTSAMGWASVIVGLAAPQRDVVPRLRAVVATLDPTLPIYDVMRVDDAIRGEFANDFLVMRLMMAFAALATVVAAIGLYGVLARGVSERRREFGIRVALGAGPAVLAGLVTREALVVLLTGAGAGAIATVWLARYLDSRLFGITRLDAASFALAAALIVIVMLVSAAPAGRRAARINAAEVIKG